MSCVGLVKSSARRTEATGLMSVKGTRSNHDAVLGEHSAD